MSAAQAAAVAGGGGGGGANTFNVQATLTGTNVLYSIANPPAGCYTIFVQVAGQDINGISGSWIIGGAFKSHNGVVTRLGEVGFLADREDADWNAVLDTNGTAIQLTVQGSSENPVPVSWRGSGHDHYFVLGEKTPCRTLRTPGL